MEKDNKIAVKNNRISYFDLLKAVAIILVIYVHYPWISESKLSNITMIITIIAVPIFFMINGALLLKSKFELKKHMKKILSLILGLIIWKLLILTYCLMSRKVYLSDFQAIDILYYFISQANLTNVPSEHLWFLYSLIRIYIIFPFIKIALDYDKKYLKYILIFSFIFSFGIEFFNEIFMIMNKYLAIPKIDFTFFSNSFSIITKDLNYIFLFCLGYYLHEKYYQVKASKKILIFYLLLYIFGLALIIISRYLQVGSFLDGGYERINNDYCKMGNLIMCVSVFIFFSRIEIKENRVTKFIGSRTINIYMIHMLILAVVSKYIFPLINLRGVKINIFKTIIVLLISIGITELLKLIKPIKKILNLS